MPGYAAAGSYANVVFTVSDGTATDSESIKITVNNVNRAPVLTAIGNKTVNEGAALSFVVSATDPDGDALTYSASNLPAGATFDASTHTFTWTPGYGASGNYAGVLFTVTDNGTPPQGVSEGIAISVGNVNRPPVLDAIGDKSVSEGQTLSVTVFASDPDADALTYGASNLPAGATFDTSTRTFTWTPGNGASGSYKGVTFTVTDAGSPAESDSESITITVGDVNRPPVLTPIGDKTIKEGQTLTFTVTASDPDNNELSFAVSNLPIGAAFDAVSQTFTWTPGYDVAGSYENVQFTVMDNGSPSESDAEAITITVKNANRPPVLNAIGNKSIAEGATLTFVVSATDPDGDVLTYSASNLPTGAMFDAATQTFTWTPASGATGNYPDVLFAVTDNGSPMESTSEAITITVGDVNRPPVLDAIGNKSIAEGATLTFVVSATDPDGDALTYSASYLPEGASFDSTTRAFTWTPGYKASGVYPGIQFTVTDAGSPAESDSQSITITVENVNRPPSFDSSDNQSVDEGKVLSFIVSASDPDGDELTYWASNLPEGAAFDPITRIFTWTPDYNAAGVYADIIFNVTDNGLPPTSYSESISITVNNINRPPELKLIGNQTIAEGATLTFIVSATDPDDDALTYSVSNMPEGATFDPLTQTFTWTPASNASGNYTDIIFTVTDISTPSASDSESITITVGNVNRPPVLAAIGNKTIAEGSTLTFVVSATDPDGDSLTYSASNLPEDAAFDAESHIFTWAPEFGSSGSYANVLFSVSDNGVPVESDSETISITVGNVNRPPVLAAIGNQTVAEGAILAFTIFATDPDGDSLTYSASNLPKGAVFDSVTHIFTWEPGYGVSGNFPDILFTVSDNGSPVESDSESITISVGDVNRPPVLAAIGNQTVAEGATLTFTVSAMDPDENPLTYSVSNIPEGAYFDSTTGVFTWAPGYGASGSYTDVVFSVADNGSPAETDSESITITVGNVNRAPVLAAIGNQTVAEGAALTFVVSATDSDGDALTYMASNLPEGAMFDAVTQTFTWTPGYDAAGAYANILFSVTDNGSLQQSDLETISITVENTNRPPLFAIIGDQTVAEGSALQFTVEAVDPDNNALAYSVSNLPEGAVFDPSTRIFIWTPNYGAAGSYANVSFSVVDDGTPPQNDSEAITITVENVNRTPVLEPIGNKTVNERETLTFGITASDQDGDALTYSVSNMPQGALFDSSTRVFSWTPDYTAAGSYANIIFSVSDGVATDSESIEVKVKNVNRAPVLTTIGNKSVDEGATLTFTVAATDPDGDSLTYSASNLPKGSTFDTATQTFTWTPNYESAGNYADVMFIVTDRDASPASDSETIAISVNNINRPPVLTSIGDKSIAETQTLSFTVSATDPDGDALTFSATNLPEDATFDSKLHTFNWTPGYDASGDYTDIVFTVTDAANPAETDSEAIKVHVSNVNRPPVLTSIGKQYVNEMQTLTFKVTATDPDGDPLVFSSSNLPNGAIFDATTQIFTWTPTKGSVGSYSDILFNVTDNGAPSANDSESITITVKEAECSTLQAPSNVIASDGEYSDHVLIIWDEVEGATAYKVYRDGVALSGWINTQQYDDLHAGSATTSRSGCFGTTTDFSYHDYQVVARNDCGNESPLSIFDTGYIGEENEKSITTLTEKIHEDVFPIKSAYPNSSFALRITLDEEKEIIDPKTVWAEMTIVNTGLTEQGGAWRPVVNGQNKDGWVLFTPSLQLEAGDEVALTVGASTQNGQSIEPITHVFLIEDGMADDEFRVAESTFIPGASSKTPIYVISPDSVFNSSQTIQIPLPKDYESGLLDIRYYSDSIEHKGWCSSQSVIGWLASVPETITENDGMTYVQIELNHGGILQILSKQTKLNKLAQQNSDIGVFAIAFALFGFLSSPKAYASLRKIRKRR
jgi:hypothetical protein